jgi:anaerobic magnesium-protoporphyrin IX monomethyl ester cyclase
VAMEWRELPGIAGIVGAEVEETLPAIVADLIAGNDLSVHAGVLLPHGESGPPARVLQNVDGLPYPDYSDFPWDAYPERIVPILVGRGCGWGRCTFCGDVVTANGRGYRARSWPKVVEELTEQSERYKTRNFTFLDIKLNSDPSLWRKLTTELPEHLPNARWIASVHVGPEEDNGLSASQLRDAYASGLRRVTFGMESASQKLLDSMDKGTQIERNTDFLRAASDAGISVRCTVMQGYPGETPEDLRITAEYLRINSQWLDRVRVNRFNALVGTRFTTEYERDPAKFPGMVNLTWDYRYARSTYDYLPSTTRAYRSGMRDLLSAVHAINRHPLKEVARAFDGVM